MSLSRLHAFRKNFARAVRRIPCSTALLVPCLLAATAGAQTPDADLASAQKLIGKPLILRDMLLNDDLTFDAAGKPVDSPGKGSFTLCGVVI